MIDAVSQLGISTSAAGIVVPFACGFALGDPRRYRRKPLSERTAQLQKVAELTCSQDSTIRQQLIERLMREIMYDAEFRRDDGTGAIGSDARH
jgi:hypothetical protein